MANELEKIVAETPAPASPEAQDDAKKLEVKSNLDKAIAEAQETLRTTREATKKAKAGIIEEDDIPQIDLNDPSAKAWDKRIKESNAPLNSQLEAQKNEVRSFALRRFLSDKPSLAKNPEKLKELMANYDRIKVATEQTQEGVLMDLDKAYGATFHDELVSAARNARVDAAKEDMITSDIAISRGSTSETAPTPIKRQMTAEERKIVEQWESHGAPSID